MPLIHKSFCLLNLMVWTGQEAPLALDDYVLRGAMCHWSTASAGSSVGKSGPQVSVCENRLVPGARAEYKYGWLGSRISIETASRWWTWPTRTPIPPDGRALLEGIEPELELWLKEEPPARASFLGVSKDRKFAIVCVFGAAPGCLWYSGEYRVVNLSKGECVARRLFCYTSPNRDCSGFVESDGIHGYWLHRDEQFRPTLVSLSTDGTWQDVSGVDADFILTSCDRTRLALGRLSSDHTVEIELRSSDLKQTLWQKRIKHSARSPTTDLRFIYSTDDKVIGVLENRRSGGGTVKVLHGLEAANGRLLGSVQLGYDPSVMHANVMQLARQPFDAEATLGVIDLRPAKKR